MNQMSMSLSARAEFWSEKIDKWNESGLSGAAYCRQEELDYSTFMYRVGKSRSKSVPKLVAVSPETKPRVSTRNDNHSVGIRIQIGSMMIEVPVGFDGPTLARIMTIVNQVD